ncbi:MAG: subtype II CRISPR-associated endonuclease Cas1 [Bacteroidetes bacterium GWA2_30_7]|nr:MAG: subtype II CRISPR-associated endonuclease Cas1 [Bacteroidetes bacterium GWA2_30_7]
MIKRTLYFGNPAYLNLHNSQLIVRLPEVEKNQSLSENFKNEAAASIPVEDIGIVILDHYQVTITQGLLEALLENNAVVVTCNSKHHPTGLLMSLSGNTIQSERFASQLEASEPLKKQLWAQTISQKIKNQSVVLEINKVDNSYLIPLYKNIKSGDSDNCEATAASYYWKHIFSSQTLPEFETLAGFKREREGTSPNNFLNYGYAILRATMARSIVGAGLLPTLGIHHHNRYNAYCLADDLMEPYRPYVDLVVCEILKTHKLNDDIPKEIKIELLKIPAIDVQLDGEKSPLMIATQRTAVSLVKCFEGDYRKILYPDLGFRI